MKCSRFDSFMKKAQAANPSDHGQKYFEVKRHYFRRTVILNELAKYSDKGIFKRPKTFALRRSEFFHQVLSHSVLTQRSAVALFSDRPEAES